MFYGSPSIVRIDIAFNHTGFNDSELETSENIRVKYNSFDIYVFDNETVASIEQTASTYWK